MPTINIGLSVISTGTVTATSGSATVTASSNGSSWQITNAGQTFTAIGQGDFLIIGSFAPEMILSGDSATQLTLQRNWPNATQTGVSYKIVRVTAAEALSSGTLALINQFLTLGLQANPLVSALVAGGARLLQIVQSGTDILFKIGSQASSTVVTDGEMAALVTAIKIDSTGKVTFPLGAPDIAKRNILYNGSLQIAQRGTTGFTVSGYTFDRWYMSVTGTMTLAGAATVPAAPAPIFQRSARFDSGAAASNALFMQAFESNDVHQFKGRRVTFSCYTRMLTGFSGNIKLFVETGDTANVVSSGAWTPLTAVTGLGTNTGGLIAPTTAFQLVSITVDVPSSLTAIRFGVTAESNQASGNIWFVAGLKVEFGTVVTEWVPEDAMTELQRCMRYFQKSYPQATVPATNTTLGQVLGRAPAAAANTTIGNLRFPAVLRTTPTMTLYNPADGTKTLTSNCVRNVDAATDVNGTVDAGTSDSGFSVSTTSVPAVGNRLTFHYTASAELA